MAEAARVLDYEYYSHGSAAPAREYTQEAPRQTETPYAQERVRQRERARAVADAKSTQVVSLFAVVGTIVVVAMMIFVVLAHISYSEVASENARLNAQLVALNEQHRRLEITFESVVCMNEIERYARDVLGMSRPGAGQVGFLIGTAADRAEVLAVPESNGSSIRDFGSFLSSLLEPFR